MNNEAVPCNAEQTGSQERVPRMSGPERRQALIENAINAFAEKGYYATTMEGIATSAGITKPVIYQHFKSKRDLFGAILENVSKQMIDTLDNSGRDCMSPEERFTKGFEAYFRFMYENRPAFQLIFSASPRRDPEFRDIVSAIDEHVASSIAMEVNANIDSDHKRLVASGVIALAEGIARKYLKEHGPEIDEQGRAVAFEYSLACLWSKRMSSLIWNGLRSLRPIRETV